MHGQQNIKILWYTAQAMYCTQSSVGFQNKQQSLRFPLSLINWEEKSWSVYKELKTRVFYFRKDKICQRPVFSTARFVYLFIYFCPAELRSPNLTICVDKKNHLDVTFCILYFSSNSCSACFGQPCAHHQELTTAWCYSLVLVCAVAARRWSRPVGR